MKNNHSNITFIFIDYMNANTDNIYFLNQFLDPKNGILR